MYMLGMIIAEYKLFSHAFYANCNLAIIYLLTNFTFKPFNIQ